MVIFVFENVTANTFFFNFKCYDSWYIFFLTVVVKLWSNQMFTHFTNKNNSGEGCIRPPLFLHDISEVVDFTSHSSKASRHSSQLSLEKIDLTTKPEMYSTIFNSISIYSSHKQRNTAYFDKCRQVYSVAETHAASETLGSRMTHSDVIPTPKRCAASSRGRWLPVYVILWSLVKIGLQNKSFEIVTMLNYRM
jgi:hypothetical protein